MFISSDWKQKEEKIKESSYPLTKTKNKSKKRFHFIQKKGIKMDVHIFHFQKKGKVEESHILPQKERMKAKNPFISQKKKE